MVRTKISMSKQEIRDLWDRISAYKFEYIELETALDHIKKFFGSKYAHWNVFQRKLEQKKGWNSTIAARVIEEYKRFCFLGIVSDSPVYPGNILIIVHLQHLRSDGAYRNFCTYVLKRDFFLLKMGEPDSSTDDMYAKTYEAYRRHFNQEPPDFIWPKPKKEVNNPIVLAKGKRKEKTYQNNGTDDNDFWLWYLLYSENEHHASVPHDTTDPDFDGFKGGSFGGGGSSSSYDDSDKGNHQPSGHDSTSLHTHTYSHHSTHDYSDHNDSGSYDSGGSDGGDSGGGGD